MASAALRSAGDWRIEWLVARVPVAMAFLAGTFFIFIGASKLQDVPGFIVILRAHALLGEALLRPAAIGTAGLEILCGVLALWSVLFPRWLIPALVVLVVLMTGFAGYAFILTVDPPPQPAPCGCGIGKGVVESWAPIAARNAGASACFIAGAFIAARYRLLPPLASRAVTRS